MVVRTGGCQGLLVSLRTWELQKVRDGGVSQKCSSLATSDSTPSWLSPPSVTAPPLLAVALHTSARVCSLSSASLGGRAGPMFSRPSLDWCPLNRHFKFGWARAQHSGSLPSHLRKQCHRRGHPAALPKPRKELSSNPWLQCTHQPGKCWPSLLVNAKPSPHWSPCCFSHPYNLPTGASPEKC